MYVDKLRDLLEKALYSWDLVNFEEKGVDVDRLPHLGVSADLAGTDVELSPAYLKYRMMLFEIARAVNIFEGFGGLVRYAVHFDEALGACRVGDTINNGGEQGKNLKMPTFEKCPRRGDRDDV